MSKEIENILLKKTAIEPTVLKEPFVPWQD